MTMKSFVSASFFRIAVSGCLIALLNPLQAGIFEKSFKIIYVSTDAVYLDGGSLDSLAVGDTLKNKEFRIIVRETASRSAVADMLAPSAPENFKIGDTFTLKKMIRDHETEPAVEPKEDNQDTQFTLAVDSLLRVNKLAGRSYTPKNRMNGQLRHTMSMYGNGSTVQNSRLSYNLDLQAWLPLKLITEFGLSIYDGSVIPNMFQFAIEWNPQKYRIQVGRIAPREWSGMGMMDGFSVSRRLGRKWSAGLTGGSRVSSYNLADYLNTFQPGGGAFLRFRGTGITGNLTYLYYQAAEVRYDIYMHPVRYTPQQEMIYAVQSSRRGGSSWSVRGNVVKKQSGSWTPETVAASFRYLLMKNTTWSASMHSRFVVPDTIISLDPFEALMEGYTRTGVRSGLAFSPANGLQLQAEYYTQINSNSDGTLPEVMSVRAQWKKRTVTASGSYSRIAGSGNTDQRTDLFVMLHRSAWRLKTGYRAMYYESATTLHSPYFEADWRWKSMSLAFRDIYNTQGQESWSQMQLTAAYRF